MSELKEINFLTYINHDKSNLQDVLMSNMINSQKNIDYMNDAIYAYFINNIEDDFYDLEKIFREKNIEMYFVAMKNNYPMCKLVDCRGNDNSNILYYVMLISDKEKYLELINNDIDNNTTMLLCAGNLKPLDQSISISPISLIRRKQLALGELKIEMKKYLESEFNNFFNYYCGELMIKFGYYPEFVELENKLFGLTINKKLFKTPFYFTNIDNNIKLFKL